MELVYEIDDTFQSGNVERREGKSHGAPAPIRPGQEGWDKQVRDFLEFCQGAKKDPRQHPWPKEVLDALDRHWPFAFPMANVPESMRKVGFGSWSAVSQFVKDDRCVTLFERIVDYVMSVGATRKGEDTDFIDGFGTGDYEAYIDAIKQGLEKAFDEKYFHLLLRPQEYFMRMFGTDCVINYDQPGHPSYPTGHDAKFCETVNVADSRFNLTQDVYITLLTIAYVAGKGRCGGGVHWPQDGTTSFQLLLKRRPGLNYGLQLLS